MAHIVGGIVAAVLGIMGIIGCAIPDMGLTEYLLPIISGALYYATPENEWAQLVHPYLPSWLVPQSAEAIKYFYEGAPRGYALPWRAWLVPLAAWLPLILAVYFAMICTMVMLRRQWVVRERLTFPLVQVPLGDTAPFIACAVVRRRIRRDGPDGREEVLGLEFLGVSARDRYRLVAWITERERAELRTRSAPVPVPDVVALPNRLLSALAASSELR